MAMDPNAMATAIISALNAAGYTAVSVTISNEILVAFSQGIINHIQAAAQATGTCPDNGGPLIDGRVV